MPPATCTSASTVGHPRESRISRARIFSIFIFASVGVPRRRDGDILRLLSNAGVIGGADAPRFTADSTAYPEG
jgi:hypothetical protein